MADRFSADPTVVFMTAVLDDLGAGRLRIPRFQRPLVWDWEQRRDLLSSILEGLPIGALMLWVSGGEPISTYPSLGPHALPRGSDSGDTRYLMDGVQRVSTLYGALKATSDWEEYDSVEDMEVQDFLVYVDLDTDKDDERFVRKIDVDAEAREADPSRWLPLYIVLDSRELLKFQRSVPKGFDHRIDRADELSSAFRSYKIPLITLNSASLDVVTKSFQRVNSRGADMSELHMLNALSYSAEFDLLKRDHELTAELLTPLGWTDLDQDVVLRCLKLRVGSNIYTTNPDDVSAKIRKDPSVLDDTFRAIERSAKFLSNHLGIGHPHLVPYRMQIVSLAGVMFDKVKTPTPQQLKDWFWLTTYTEAFGSSARQSEDAMEDLRRLATSNKFEWSLKAQPTVRPLRELRVDFRAARVKALALALAARADGDAPNGAAQLITIHGRDAFCQLPFDLASRGRAGNRFLVAPSEAPTLKLKILEGTLTPEEKSMHLLSDAALTALSEQNYSSYLDLREQDMYAFERDKIILPAASRLGVNVKVPA